MTAQGAIGLAIAGAVVAVALCLAGSAAGQGLSENYRRQETTRCSYGQGCPRMLRNAVSHAEQYCRGRGGVRSGGSSRDFKCEQRGIYCSVVGRITCNGVFDPDTAGAPPGLSLFAPPERGPTCLDAGCNRFVDHAPGRREQGVHACPPGYGMVGLSRPRGDIVCQAVDAEERETVLDADTERDGMRSCPAGMYLRGLSDNRNLLLCVRGTAKVGVGVEQRESETHGIQVCEEDGEEPRFVIGLDVESAGLRCARVR